MPAGLDGIAQGFAWLDVGVDAYRKGKRFGFANGDGIVRVTAVPAEDRRIGTQGRGIDIVRGVGTADAVQESHLGADKIVQHPQVVSSRVAVIARGNRYREQITGIGARS